MRVILALLAFAFFTGSAHADASHGLIRKWETEAQLKVPESVLYDSHVDVPSRTFRIQM